MIPNKSFSYNIHRYFRPIWYFHLIPYISNTSIWIDYRKLPNDKKCVINYDNQYSTESMSLWDASFQSLNRGIINNDENLNYRFDIEYSTQDFYRFIRKYYKHIWLYYALILRIVYRLKPLDEIKQFLLSRNTKKENLFQPVYNYDDFDSFSPNLEDISLISIIIPTLNRYDALSILLKDLENQKFKKFEVIIIDQSNNYNEEFYKGFNLNIKLIRQKEKALWKARNKGIIESESDILFFLDDDTRINNDWIIQHIKCLEFFDTDISSGISISKVGSKVPENYSFFHIADQLDTGNVVIHKKVFAKCGLFDLQFESQRMGDGEFGLRAYLNGFKCISNPFAKRFHMKLSSGGLREMGSWDGFRPKNWLSPRPIPSVLYYWRKYWGNQSAIFGLIQNIPFAFSPYKLKGTINGNIFSLLFFIILFPLTFTQVLISWHKSSKMLKLGDKIPHFGSDIISSGNK
jgi:glycosyltransferase involved in cell wall biosynthesis